MTAAEEEPPQPRLLRPLPDRPSFDLAGYAQRMLDLLRLLDAAPPEVPRDDPTWATLARRAAVAALVPRVKAGPVPDEWCEPLVGAAVRDPDPSFNRYLVEPAVVAFGRRRVQSLLLDCLRDGSPADIAGAARAWYWTQVPLFYRGESTTPTPESAAEAERYSDLRRA